MHAYTIRQGRRAAAATALVAGMLLLAACGGDKGVTGPSIPSTPRTAVPSVLAGDWMYGSISPTNFWNDHTGQYAGNAYGFAAYYQLAPNGNYTALFYIYTQQYSCRTQVYTRMEGTVTVDDEDITFYPQKGQYKVTDTCAASRNYERPMTLEELQEKQGQSYSWYIDNYTGENRLMLGIAGEPVEFKRPD